MHNIAYAHDLKFLLENYTWFEKSRQETYKEKWMLNETVKIKLFLLFFNKKECCCCCYKVLRPIVSQGT